MKYISRISVFIVLILAIGFFQSLTSQSEEEISSKILDYLSSGDKAYNEGRLKDALDFYEKMKALIKKTDYFMLGVYHNRVGRTNILLKNLERAIEYLNIADDYFKKLLKLPVGKDDVKLAIAFADNLVDLSIAYRNSGNYDLALRKGQDAILVYKTYGDKDGEAKAMTCCANVLYLTGQFDEALKIYESALRIYEEMKNNSGIGKIYNNIAVVYVKKGDYITAIEFYNISIDYKYICEDYWGIALTYRNIAVLYEVQNDLRNAYQMMLKCVEVAGKYKDPNLEEYQKYLDFIKVRLNA